MTFPVNPKRMMEGHTISYKIHSFGRYRKGSRLDELRRSNVGWHVEFMAVHALSNQTAACELFLTRRKILGMLLNDERLPIYYKPDRCVDYDCKIHCMNSSLKIGYKINVRVENLELQF